MVLKLLIRTAGCRAHAGLLQARPGCAVITKALTPEPRREIALCVNAGASRAPAQTTTAKRVLCTAGCTSVAALVRCRHDRSTAPPVIGRALSAHRSPCAALSTGDQSVVPRRGTARRAQRRAGKSRALRASAALRERASRNGAYNRSLFQQSAPAGKSLRGEACSNLPAAHGRRKGVW